MKIQKVIMLFIAVTIFSNLRSDVLSPQKIINRVEQKLGTGKNIKIHFKEMFIWKLAGEDQTIEGELYLQGETKFCILTPDQQIVSDGKDLYTFSKPANRVLIDRVGKSEDVLLPRQILFQYTENHRARVIGEEKIDGNPCHVLEFIHETGEAYFPTVHVWVDKKVWIPRKIEQIDLYENRTVYLLKSVEIDVEFSGNRFHFLIPDSAEVIDMR